MSFIYESHDTIVVLNTTGRGGAIHGQVGDSVLNEFLFLFFNFTLPSLKLIILL